MLRFSVRRIFGLASLLGLAAVPVSAQVRAEPGRFEIQGLDFRADGAWRRGARAVPAQRHRLLAAREFSLLTARIEGARTGPAVTGTYAVPVIPLRYSNISPASVRAPADGSDLLFSPAPSDRLLSARPSTEVARAIVTGDLGDGLLLRVYVPDLAGTGSLGMEIMQVAQQGTYSQRSLAGYGLVVQP